MDEKIEYNPAWGICKPICNGCEYEIAKIICKATHNAELKHCEIICNVDCTKYGKAIKESGYRKESDTAREIYKELFEKQTEVYNKYVFKKDNDYDDLETNAIINFSDSLSYEFEKYFKEKYGVDLGE
jgi:hypothetical protein